MGTLKCDSLNFNDTVTVETVQKNIQTILNNQQNYHVLTPTNGCFSTSEDLTEEGGWYIILAGKLPIYVGKADNLNGRLNTSNGSRDNFNNSKRESDSARNFIKKYAELRIIQNLRVCIISKSALFDRQQITELDSNNTEKFLNIWRGIFQYQ